MYESYRFNQKDKCETNPNNVSRTYIVNIYLNHMFVNENIITFDIYSTNYK